MFVLLFLSIVISTCIRYTIVSTFTSSGSVTGKCSMYLNVLFFHGVTKVLDPPFTFHPLALCKCFVCVVKQIFHYFYLLYCCIYFC